MSFTENALISWVPHILTTALYGVAFFIAFLVICGIGGYVEAAWKRSFWCCEFGRYVVIVVFFTILALIAAAALVAAFFIVGSLGMGVVNAIGW